MSKHNDSSAEDFNSFEDEQELSLEPVLEQGPTPTIAPQFGTVAKILTRYTHCEICQGRLHFNYISDFSRNTTHEKSSCPECNLDTRQVLHRLQ